MMSLSLLCFFFREAEDFAVFAVPGRGERVDVDVVGRFLAAVPGLLVP